MKASAIQYIEEDLKSDSPGSLLNLSDSLVRLATWHGNAGQVALLNGNGSGWMEIHRAWLYLALAYRIRITLFQKGRVLGQFRPVKSLETEAAGSALCLAYALAVRRDFETKYFGDAVRRMLIEKESVREAYWTHHYTEAFSIQLLALSRRESLDVVKNLRRRLGAYQAIIDAWDHPASLVKAISDACDFHCERIEDNSEKFTAEFRSPPFDLAPAEILAVYAVRQSLGLETPAVDHPLLEPPFSTPVGSPDEIADSLLDDVEAKLQAGGALLVPLR